MTRINQADHVLLLLQEQLHRMGRARGGRTARAGSTSSATPPPLVRLQSSAALDQMSEDDVRRTLVRALLSEELGEGIANDPNFQTMVDDVYRIIEGDERGRALIASASRQLRQGR